MERTNNVHKFTVYVYGFNDLSDCSPIEAAEALCNQKYDYSVHPYLEKTVKVKEIDDDHPLNKSGLSQEDLEKYMDETLNRLFQNKLKADKEFEAYKTEMGIDKENPKLP